MLTKPKILVVDADKNILSAFSDYLRTKNCSMVGVSKIKNGLRRIRLQTFNLLIADVKTGNEFGTDYIAQIRKMRSDLPIIAITSYPDKVHESDLKMYGVEYLFVKPLELRKLDKAIDNCLGSKVNIVVN